MKNQTPIFLNDEEIIKVACALETMGDLYGRSGIGERREELYKLSLEIKSQHLIGSQTPKVNLL